MYDKCKLVKVQNISMNAMSIHCVYHKYLISVLNCIFKTVRQNRSTVCRLCVCSMCFTCNMKSALLLMLYCSIYVVTALNNYLCILLYSDEVSAQNHVM